MNVRRTDPRAKTLSATLSRRAALVRLGAAGTAAAFLGRTRAAAQEATPAVAGECVATAPPADASGIGVVDLLIGGLVPDMPPGPVKVTIARFTLEPGALVEPAVDPNPAFMYIEAGESMCPGGPGRVVYNPDGSVLDVSTGDGFQRIPTGTTQYIPAGVPDGASNQGSTLMSSLVLIFEPAEAGATPATGTPAP